MLHCINTILDTSGVLKIISYVVIQNIYHILKCILNLLYVVVIKLFLSLKINYWAVEIVLISLKFNIKIFLSEKYNK